MYRGFFTRLVTSTTMVFDETNSSVPSRKNSSVFSRTESAFKVTDSADNLDEKTFPVAIYSHEKDSRTFG
jgi:hypothetical protein